MLWDNMGHLQLWKKHESPDRKYDGDRVREKERGKEGGREQQVLSLRQRGPSAGWGRKLHLHCFFTKNQCWSWISVCLCAALLQQFAGIYCSGSLFSMFTRDPSEGTSAPSEQLPEGCWSPGPAPHKSGGSDPQRSLCLKCLLHFSVWNIKDHYYKIWNQEIKE